MELGLGDMPMNQNYQNTQRQKFRQVRKLLIFRNGQFDPENDSMRDAIDNGKIELEAE